MVYAMAETLTVILKGLRSVFAGNRKLFRIIFELYHFLNL